MTPTLRLVTFLIIAASTSAPLRMAHSQEPVTTAVITGGLSVAAGAIGNITIGKIFDRIAQSIDQASKAATAAGNELLGNAAIQAHELMQQQKALLDDEREKTFQQLSDQRKLMIWDLYQLADKLQTGSGDELAKGIVDAHKLIAQIAFIGKDVEFLIVRVGPTVVEKKSLSAAPIQIFGIGFGTDYSGKHFDTQVTIGGHPIPRDRILLKDWGISLNLRSDDFGNAWAPNEYSHVPLLITSTIEDAGAWWCRWAGCKNSKSFSARYDFTLFPSGPTKLKVIQQGEELQATDQEQWVQFLLQLPDMNNAKHKATTPSGPQLAGDGWRWASDDPHDPSTLHDHCEKAGDKDACPFVTGQHCQSTGDHTIVQCYADNDGPPAHYLIAAKKIKVSKQKVELATIQLEGLPSEVKRIEIERSAVAAWIEGINPLGKSIGPISLRPAGGAGSDPVICTYSGDVADKSIFDCRISPAW
ncbi:MULTISPECIES: hypothetical protein [unclassified Bradyrhizobium]|uniref:hypothetical protein n=1 Tax=unclassified Bradyrhizobium TaxID=2631580 RepID=UPI00291644F0|nr:MULTISPECIES: hypothetical protein [unclassified Bradyrhizobium]